MVADTVVKLFSQTHPLIQLGQLRAGTQPLVKLTKGVAEHRDDHEGDADANHAFDLGSDARGVFGKQQHSNDGQNQDSEGVSYLPCVSSAHIQKGGGDEQAAVCRIRNQRWHYTDQE